MKKKIRPTALGVDFGGTSVKVGLVDAAGRVLRKTQVATSAVASRSAWLDFVGSCLEQFASACGSPAGIGVGVPGFVDFERGFIYNLTNVPGWKSVPLAGLLRKRFGMPAFVDNDVNAMSRGECAFGAGRRHRHALFVTLGTGVGGALMLNGKIYRGAYSMAGEIGHLSINRFGPRNAEGRGGLETYVGNTAIVALARRALRKHRAPVLHGLAGGDASKITPKLLAAAAARGEQSALEIFENIADCLATAFASAVYLIQPEIIVVGGGVAQCGGILFAPLRRKLKERLHPSFAARVRIVPALLGADAGLIGCATLALPGNCPA